MGSHQGSGSIETRILREHRLEFVIWRGELHPAQIIAAVLEQIRSPQITPPARALYDGRDLRVMADSGAAEVRDFARFHSEELEWPKGQRNAFVVPGEVEFGLARMFTSLAAGSPAEHAVFREWADAVHWLGLPPDFDPEKRPVPA